MMEQIRLAVIGTGLAWERLHWPALEQLQKEYRIVAMCDQDENKVNEAAGSIGLGPHDRYTDYKEMLNRDDIDAVVVAVPIPLNFEVAQACARAGKHVILEKPLAPNMKEAKRARDLAKRFGVQVMVAENYRYNDENNILRDLVAERKVGDVVYFIRNDVACFPCHMSGDSFAGTEWRQHPEFEGGVILDAALHDIAAVRHIFGAVDRVSAFGVPQEEDFSPYRSIHVNMLFQSGVVGHFSYWPSGHEMQRPLIGTRIFGTEGMIYLEERTSGVINVTMTDGTHEMIPFEPNKGYYNEFLNFYKALRGEEALGVTPEIEYGDVRMVFEILDSIEHGGRVRIVDDVESFEMVTH